MNVIESGEGRCQPQVGSIEIAPVARVNEAEEGLGMRLA